ncbi:hypothetical protein F5Y03DRAFT_390136 [Xylaria venustula]|nr:hypothetical protein F5Y03DRAFT_390136 [Xylaria venustula]
MSSVSGDIAAAVRLLQSALPDNVVTPETVAEYESEKTRPWSQSCWTSAAAFIRPQDSAGVAEVLKIITKTKTKFALRTHGHTPNPGFNGTGNAGVVIDLQNLSSMSLDVTKTVLDVGAGANWSEVYKFLEKNELSAIGGRDAVVVILRFPIFMDLALMASKALRYSFPYSESLTPKAIWLDFRKVVLADSSIVTADADNNPNLFKALKGGGSNFETATSVKLHVHPLIKIQYTLNLYAESDFANIIKATVKTQEAMKDDFRANLFTNFHNGFVVSGLLYGGTPEEQPEAFKSFADRSSQINTLVPKTNGTILSLATAMAHEIKLMKRTIGTVTTKVSYDLYFEVYKMWKEVIGELPAGIDSHYTIHPVSASAVEAGERRGGNAMGLQKDSQCCNQTLIGWVFTAEWPDDEHDQAARQAVSKLVRTVQSLAVGSGHSLEYLWMNFADSTQDVLSSYGSANLQSLRDVAAQYDPEGVFQSLQNDGFLLRKI